jgi:hypothetical protein
VLIASPARTADPLPSWNDGSAKRAILDFVRNVSTKDSSGFVPPAERIAAFDNDGTLWPEQPMYTQLAFAIERVKRLADQHPEWKTTQPFQAVLENDLAALAASGEKGLAQLVLATHAGLSTDEFDAIVTAWFKTARHPRFQRPYTELAFKPMVELLDYLRASSFKTYIVSGGGIEFMRPMTLAAYGVPPEQVVGSSIRTRYELREGKPVLMRLPEIDFIDDHAGKPVGIQKFIGRRPIAAFGNSAGDREMLEWTAAGTGPRLMMLVFHDDARREFAYGPANGLADSGFGTFDQTLMNAAKANRWNVISMKTDWAQVFRFRN